MTTLESPFRWARPAWVRPSAATLAGPVQRLGLGAAAALGILLVAVAYRGIDAPTPTLGQQTLVWVGVLAGVLPAAVWLISRVSERDERLFALVVLAAVTAAPRFLRSAGPVFDDEFFNWRAAVDVAHGFGLGGGGLVAGTHSLPGLPVLLGSVSAVSGLSLWSATMLVLGLAHLAGLVAVFCIAETLFRDARVAGAAALVYGISPVALYGGLRMNTVALAVPLALVALALAVRGAMAASPGRWRGLVAGAVAVLALVAVTDFFVLLLAALVLLGTAVLVALSDRAQPVQIVIGADFSVTHRAVGPVEAPRRWWFAAGAALALTALAALAVWLSGGAFQTSAWFPPLSLFSSPGRATGIEPALAVLATLILLVPAAEHLWTLWFGAERVAGPLKAYATLGLFYFLGLPAGLLLAGSAPLRGAWTLTFAGVALLVAPVLIRTLDAARAFAVSRWQGSLVPPTVALLVAVLLIGNSAAAEGVALRYPGPVQYGRDGRADLAEIRSLAEGFGVDVGRVGVLTDRYTAPAFAGFSGARIAPVSDLLPGNELLQGVDPTAAQVTALLNAGFTHLVVDTRMADVDPMDGPSFGPADPAQGRLARTTALDRLDRVPWVSRVASSPDYRVYRLQIGGAGAPLVVQGDAWGPDFRPLPGTAGAGATGVAPASSAYNDVHHVSPAAETPTARPAAGRSAAARSATRNQLAGATTYGAIAGGGSVLWGGRSGGGAATGPAGHKTPARPGGTSGGNGGGGTKPVAHPKPAPKPAPQPPVSHPKPAPGPAGGNGGGGDNGGGGNRGGGDGGGGNRGGGDGGGGNGGGGDRGGGDGGGGNRGGGNGGEQGGNYSSGHSDGARPGRGVGHGDAGRSRGEGHADSQSQSQAQSEGGGRGPSQDAPGRSFAADDHAVAASARREDAAAAHRSNTVSDRHVSTGPGQPGQDVADRVRQSGDR